MLSTTEINASYAVRGINKERLKAVRKFAGHSILDVGCGSGAYVLKLAEKYQISGVDYQRFPSWNEKPHLFSISDAEQLNLEDSSVDTILSFETLEHLSNPEQALREYYRVCRKNIILTVPNCQITPGMEKSKMIYYHWIDSTHINFFNQTTIIELVKNVGFQVHTNYYINQINLQPLLSEALAIPVFFDKILKKFLEKQKRSYYLTCLLVACKSQGD